jgi:UDP-2,3-diacylglucosamine pyrophosphatase LpxH
LTELPQYDELHVVSDLHMGGKPGFQILREGKRLAGFIRWVGEQRPGGKVALVLNGDVIDSLAEDIRGYVAVDEALAMVERIFADPSFAPVWNALAEFVAKKGRTLVIVLGNHDIELAFPWVQRAVLARLAGDDAAARARVEFSTMGAGFTCLIGNSRVFCTHGNEVDAWNYVRYEDLSKAARRMNSGRSLAPAEWQPNAGTKMVKDVMNDVKKRYAWIDLLKPEESAAVGILLVLDPEQAWKIKQLIPVIGEKLRGTAEFDQRLSASGFAAATVEQTRNATVDQLLGPNLAQGVKSAGAASSEDAMLLEAERAVRTDRADAAAPDQTLGTGQLIWDRLTGWITGVGRDEALRRALQDWLRDDKTFEVSHRDPTFAAVSESVGSTVDFIVTGHTHLERAIDMGGRYYFNTGTWIRLLRFTDAMLKSTASFKEAYDILMKGTMESIDNAKLGDKPWLLDRTSAVSIAKDDAGVVGQLWHVQADGTQRERVGPPFRRP